MKLAIVDWILIGGYIVFALGIGIFLTRRASKNTEEFFIAGRNLPWWIVGTSIVATTFAADTPLAIAGLVRSEGIYKNWIWWNALLGGMLCTFFYAKLWRRAGILTDAELIELRYSGKKATFLRGLIAVYRGVIINSVVMGWVILAMAKLSEVLLGWPKLTSIAILITIAFIYTALSGFWGVVLTDLVQFAMAMTGSIALAWIAIDKIGGIGAIKIKLAQYTAENPQLLNFAPDFSTASKLAILTFATALTLQWWANGEGNGYLAQRFFSAKNEKHALFASLWFNFAHYALRPWPWILVGITSLFFFPPFREINQIITPELLNSREYLSAIATLDPERSYPMMIDLLLPTGLKGLLIASLLAAFMSTIDTHLNWGSSYLINDIYRRFIAPDKDERHYVLAARITMLLLMATAGTVALMSETISDAWLYIFVLGSGTGFVLLLRWYWWRINAWSEISALLTALLIASGKLLLPILENILSPNVLHTLEKFYSSEYFPIRLIATVTITAAVWLTTTLLTEPEPTEKLEKFYKKVQPGGWWRPIQKKINKPFSGNSAGQMWLGWAVGSIGIYSALFGIGKIFVGTPLESAFWLSLSAYSSWVLWRFIKF